MNPFTRGFLKIPGGSSISWTQSVAHPFRLPLNTRLCDRHPAFIWVEIPLISSTEKKKTKTLPTPITRELYVEQKVSVKERPLRRMNLLLVGLFSCARKQSRFLVLFLQFLCRSEHPRPAKARILNTRNVLGWLDTLTPFNLLFIFKHIDY